MPLTLTPLVPGSLTLTVARGGTYPSPVTFPSMQTYPGVGTGSGTLILTPSAPPVLVLTPT